MNTAELLETIRTYGIDDRTVLLATDDELPLIHQLVWKRYAMPVHHHDCDECRFITSVLMTDYYYCNRHDCYIARTGCDGAYASADSDTPVLATLPAMIHDGAVIPVERLYRWLVQPDFADYRVYLCFVLYLTKNL